LALRELAEVHLRQRFGGAEAQVATQRKSLFRGRK
jgi:hypothetical protein